MTHVYQNRRDSIRQHCVPQPLEFVNWVYDIFGRSFVFLGDKQLTSDLVQFCIVRAQSEAKNSESLTSLSEEEKSFGSETRKTIINFPSNYTLRESIKKSKKLSRLYGVIKKIICVLISNAIEWNALDVGEVPRTLAHFQFSHFFLKFKNKISSWRSRAL